MEKEGTREEVSQTESKDKADEKEGLGRASDSEPLLF